MSAARLPVRVIRPEPIAGFLTSKVVSVELLVLRPCNTDGGELWHASPRARVRLDACRFATLQVNMPAGQMPNEKDRGAAIPIQDELPVIIRALRQPAGDDPRFQSMEMIRQNRAEFLKRVHTTWKRIHMRSLEEILQIEAILTPDQRKQLPKDFVWFLDRTALLWRRINDALVWLLVGQQDHVIRTVCHRKDRLRLSEANSGPMLKFLESVNAEPQTIVIWSDATTCVDVGDIVCRSFSGSLNGFIEVKEGVINKKILDLMNTKGTPEEITSRIADFAEQYGPKAMKQLDRVVRQQQRHGQVTDILNRDRGFHPHRQAEVTISDSTVPVESYDHKLQDHRQPRRYCCASVHRPLPMGLC